MNIIDALSSYLSKTAAAVPPQMQEAFGVDRSTLPFRETTDTFITGDKGKLLARDMGHYINFPGGGVDPGETPEQATIRETLEETGAHITDPEIMETINMVWPESWADTPKRKERYGKYQGEKIHLIRAALDRIGRPTSAEGDAWDEASFHPGQHLVERVQAGNPDPLMAEYREAQVRAIQSLMEKDAAPVRVRISNPEGQELQHHFVRAGKWGLPGGQMEEGETPLEAAVRELLERTGYKIDPKVLKDLGLEGDFHTFAGESGHLEQVAKPGELGGYSTKVKYAEYAPGIPRHKKIRKIPEFKKTRTWDMTVHEHQAERAGKHYDLRLSDGTHAHSWAVRKGVPGPGVKHLAVQQPTHTHDYMSFKGEIPEGYGKGHVGIADRGPVRIIESKPDKIRFVTTHKRDPEEFVLLNPKGMGTEKDWLLYNITPTRDTRKDIPNAKPKYREAKTDQLHQYLDPRYLLGAKIDGAHVITEFKRRAKKGVGQATPRIFSYRPSQRSKRLINHTHRVPGVDDFDYPSELEGTIVRGEIYGIDKATGRAIPAAQLGGILNSTTQNSLRKQEEEGVELRKAMFDVVKYKGKDVENAPYAEKLKILKEINKLTPKQFEIPEYAIRETAKLNLFNKIKSGDHPATSEGVIAWNMETGGPPVKLKIRPDYDVYVRDIFEGGGKYKGKAAGGFTYSHTPRGKVVGRVGTGFTDDVRKDMWKNSKKYKGKVAKVTSLEQFPSGALRAPSFTGQWHLEKGRQ